MSLGLENTTTRAGALLLQIACRVDPGLINHSVGEPAAPFPQKGTSEQAGAIAKQPAWVFGPIGRHPESDCDMLVADGKADRKTMSRYSVTASGNS